MEGILEFEMSLIDKIKFLSHFITKIILYVVVILLFAIFMLFGVYFLDSVYNIKNNVNTSPLFNFYVIISPSMVPTIRVQDGIIIKRDNNLEMGDIITFSSRNPKYSGATITHRIVGVEKTENGEVLYRTKGDNNNISDNYLVHKEDIYGRVLFKIPKIGYVRNYLLKPTVWIFIVVALSIFLVLYDTLKNVIRTKIDYISAKKLNLFDDEII